MEYPVLSHNKWHHELLNKTIKRNNFECCYCAGDEYFINYIVSTMGEVDLCLKEFYGIRSIPFVVIYVYHDLQMMNEAYGRNLPSDQCCFVPIKGDVSLITFTTAIGESCVRPVLVHEMSHVVFSYLSGNQEVDNIQQTIPVWLDEGVALYLDNTYRLNKGEIERNRRNLLQYPKTDYFPRLPSLYAYFNRIDDSVEFGPKGMMAYAYSYFCVSSLINDFGKDTVVDFIKKLRVADCSFDESFEVCFGVSLDEFDNAMEAIVCSGND